MFKGLALAVIVVALAYLFSLTSRSYFPQLSPDLSSVLENQNQLENMALTSVTRNVVKKVLSIEQEEVRRHSLNAQLFRQ